ncbi:MAG: ROK family protein [Thermoleophilaceae bacterium]
MKARGGIDLGGTKIQAAVIDGRGAVVGSSRRETPTSGGPPAVVAEMAGALEDAAGHAGVAARQLAGVGVGSPGEVDEQAGTVASAGNLPNWDSPYPVAAELAEALGVDVTIGNDVQVATVAEFRLGAGRPYDSVLGVFWGTGVGGGLVLDGRPWIGRGAAAEVGHMVIKVDGARCTCGRRGCVEAYAGRAAMERRARRKLAKGKRTELFEIMSKRGKDRLTSGIWEHALDAGDALAAKLVDRAIAALGAGVASAVNLLDVPAVILGGGLGLRLGPGYLPAIEQAMEPHLFVSARPPDVRVAALGDLSGAIGAALLADSRPPATPRRRPVAAVRSAT